MHRTWSLDVVSEPLFLNCDRGCTGGVNSRRSSTCAIKDARKYADRINLPFCRSFKMVRYVPFLQWPRDAPNVWRL